MTISIGATVVDVRGKKLEPKMVAAFLDGGATRLELAKKAPGSYAVALPDGSSDLTLNLAVSLEGFMPVRQDVTIQRGSSPPTADYGATQHLNVRGAAAVHDEGSGANFTVVVDVVMGHLSDAAADVAPLAKPAGPFRLSFRKRSITTFETPILNPTGTGEAVFNSKDVASSAKGPLLWANRTGSLRLLALADPGWAPSYAGDPAKYPLSFHIFFPPTSHGTWTDYHLGNDYIDFVSRYVLLNYTESHENDHEKDAVNWSKGKSLAYQNVSHGGRTIFIFPVGSKDDQLRDLATQDDVLRLVQELAYWYERVRDPKVRIPRRKIHAIDISCFSNGAENLTRIMNAAPSGAFASKLRMVCILDGKPSEAKPLHGPLTKWYKAGKGERHLRIYSQYSQWNIFENDGIDATKTAGAADSFEVQSPSFTLLHTTIALWQMVDPSYDTGSIHQRIPAVFLEHAMSRL